MNKRIKDIINTASSFNSDDYFAIDGATAGTRKVAANSVPISLTLTPDTLVYENTSGQLASVTLGSSLSLSSGTLNTAQGLTTSSTPTFAGLQLTPAGAPAYVEGKVFYDSSSKSLCYYNDNSAVTVNIARESITRVRNMTGTTIANGKVVYINGATGQNPTIALAQANTFATSRVIGVTTNAIDHTQYGYITVMGEVHDINTGSFTDGQSVYLSTSSAGEFTTSAGTAPNYNVCIGTVTYAHNSNGILLVHPNVISVSATDIVDSSTVGRSVLTAATAADAATAIGLGIGGTVTHSTLALSGTTAATTVNTGTLRAANFGFSGALGGPSYLGGDLSTTGDLVSSSSSLNQVAAAKLPVNAPIYSGSQTRGAYVYTGLGESTSPLCGYVVAQAPLATPSAVKSLFRISPTGAGAGRLFQAYWTTGKALQFDITGATVGNTRSATVANVCGSGGTYSGKMVGILWEITSAGVLTVRINGVSQTTSETTGGASFPANWITGINLSTIDTGTIGTDGLPGDGLIKHSVALGELSTADRTQIEGGMGWPGWMVVVGGAGVSRTLDSAWAKWYGTGTISSATTGGFTVDAGASGLAVTALATTNILPYAKNGSKWVVNITAAAGITGSLKWTDKSNASSAVALASGTGDYYINVLYTHGTLYLSFDGITSVSGGAITINSIKQLGLIADQDPAAQVPVGATQWPNTANLNAPWTLPATGWSPANGYANGDSYSLGRSVAGMLNGKSVGQAMVFNGGTVSGTNVAKGTGDFHVYVPVYFSGTPATTVNLVPDATNAFLLYTGSSLKLYSGKSGVTGNTPSTLSIPTGKWVMLEYIRISGVGYYYFDGVLAGTTTDTQEYSANGTANWGSGLPAGSMIGTRSIHLLSALATAERTAFANTGLLPARVYVPGGAGTAVAALNNWANYNLSTFSGESTTGYTATSVDTTARWARNTSFITTLLNKQIGAQYRFAATLTLNSGQAPSVLIVDTSGGTERSAAVQLTNGANSITLTTTSAFVGSIEIWIRNTAATDYLISGISVTPLGVTFEGSDSQPGIGSTLYDVSGAARNATLGAGVTWAVQSSGTIPINSIVPPSGTLTVSGLVSASSDIQVVSATYPILRAQTATTATGFPIVQLNHRVTGGRDYAIEVGRTSGVFAIRDNTAANDRLQIDASGNLSLTSATTATAVNTGGFKSANIGLSTALGGAGFYGGLFNVAGGVFAGTTTLQPTGATSGAWLGWLASPRLTFTDSTGAVNSKVADFVMPAGGGGLKLRMRNDAATASTEAYAIAGVYENITGHTWYLGNQVQALGLNSSGLSVAASTASTASNNGALVVTGGGGFGGTVSSGAGRIVKTLVVTGNTTLDNTHHIVVCNSTSALTITLPSPNTRVGQLYIIKNKNSGTVTVSGTLFSDAAVSSYDLGQGDSIEIVDDGAVWNII
jgi:hypothetical protein